MKQDVVPLQSDQRKTCVSLATRSRTHWFRWTVALSYFCVLNYLLFTPNPWWVFGHEPSAPSPEVGGIDLNSAMHVLTFAALSSLTIWASCATSIKEILLWALFVSGFGVASEWLQDFVPNRTGDWMDALEDVLGCVVGCVLIVMVRRLI
jgi:VanZ family protein